MNQKCWRNFYKYNWKRLEIHENIFYAAILVGFSLNWKNVFDLTTEFPNDNMYDGSQCSVEANACLAILISVIQVLEFFIDKILK